MARIALGYIVAAVVAFLLAALAHSAMNGAALAAAGAPMPWSAWTGMAAGDLAGLGPQFGAVVAAALGAGLLVAGLANRFARWPAALAFALGGGAALAAVVLVMRLAFDGITPIAGARGALGLAMQAIAGAAGGLVFAIVSRKRAKP
jgi:hypothetical protein